MAKPIKRKILKYVDFKKVKNGIEKAKKHIIKEGVIFEGDSNGLWDVFNVTDGVYASNEPIKGHENAEHYVSDFIRFFGRQGYYQNSNKERIKPEDVELDIIPHKRQLVAENVNEASSDLDKADQKKISDFLNKRHTQVSNVTSGEALTDFLKEHPELASSKDDVKDYLYKSYNVFPNKSFAESVVEGETVSPADKLKVCMDTYVELENVPEHQPLFNNMFKGSKISSAFIYRAHQMRKIPQKAYDSYISKTGINKVKVDAYIDELYTTFSQLKK